MEQTAATAVRMPAPAAMTARVMSEARRVYGTSIDDGLLARCVDQAVAGLWTESTKVTTFIPVLALRDVRDMLERNGRAT